MHAQLLHYQSGLAINGGRIWGTPIPEEGLLPLQVLASALQKCSSRKETLHIHTLICNCGVEANTPLGSYLIAAFAANNSIYYAQQVFDRLIYRSECSWNTLISGYYTCEKPREALSVYKQMRDDDTVHITSQTFVVLLQFCAKLKDLERGLEIHSELCEAGLLDGNFLVGSELVHMYGKCGSLPKAQQVIDTLIIRDDAVWTALITTYSEHGFGNDALGCLEQMKCEGVVPNASTFVSTLKVCTCKGMMDNVSRLHVLIEWHGLVETDLVLGNTLIDVYGKTGMLASALKVFDNLPVRDVVSWTSLMSGFVNNDQNEVVLLFYQKMIFEGLSPNSFTCMCYLKACGGLGDTCRGQEIHMEMERKGLLGSHPFIGSSLVDFYAKAGLMLEAKYVFCRVPFRDVVLWTSLIGGYSQEGHGAEALECFDRMQLDGVSPNALTFAFVLEACKSLGAIDRAQEIHAELERQGLFGGNLHLGNTLIDLYVQFGMLEKGQEVFDCLLSRNRVSWNTIIAGYAEHGHGEKALHLFKDMNCQGVFPDAVTFFCILKVCGSICDVKIGQVVHAEIEKQGVLEDDVHIGGALVNMYANCGSVEDARLVFDELSVRDVAAWTALIAGHVKHGCSEDALECYGQMQLQSITPNAITLLYSLKACRELGAIEKGFEIHAEIDRQGLLKTDRGISISLVRMYLECGLLAFAQQVLDRFYAEHGVNIYSKGALECFEKIQPECLSSHTHSYISNLIACSNAGIIDRELHVEIERKGLHEKDVFVGNTLIGMYTRSGQLAKARQVFDALQVCDVVSWNALMSGYVGQGCYEEALKCLEQLQFVDVCPDAITYILSLKACTEVVDARMGSIIYLEIERQGLVGTDPFIGSALIEMFTKFGFLEKAQKVFDKFTARNLVLWNVLMEGYAQNGYARETLKCLEEMQREGVYPSTATYLSCLKACGTTGAVIEGIELHTEIARKELLEDLLVGSTLVDMYAKCGQLCMAQEVFNKLSVQDVVSWTALMAGYSRIGESKRVFPVFNRMLRESIKPDPVSFLVLLSACKYTGLVNKTLSYFELMSKEHGIDPSLDHTMCVVDILGRAGQIDTAIELIKKMPCSSNLRIWDTVLATCRYWGNVNLGRIAFQSALRFDEHDAMAYVLMSYLSGDVDYEDSNKFSPGRFSLQC